MKVNGHGIISTAFARVGRPACLPAPGRPTPSPREQRHPASGDVTKADLRQARLEEADLARRMAMRRADLLRGPAAFPRYSAEFPPRSTLPPPLPATDDAVRPPTPPTYARKSYAPDAVGAVTSAPADEPPRSEAVTRIVTDYVTNLGTLLDVLA